ncbi:XdhC family protein [Jidongwangia harbinensis]|uniref:XdhC family protein n=1 Tax=Jidongwangia harbinensis TaxID=2878561 RepID=UPI001CD91C93|nr:XdhC family protein [Jidongwangia harbinensis]MCA2219069.1 XdhC family protein [Jidongwangia harbinensis]
MLREIWPFVEAHRNAGRAVVLARLVDRDGPGPRPLGATMAVAADGTWSGSLSGGCVEGQVLEVARAVLTGTAAQVITVTPGAELLPWEEAPVCAAELRVLVVPAPDDPIRTAITAALRDDRRLAVRVQLNPPFEWALAAEPIAGTFVDELWPRPQLIVVGVTDLAVQLATLAHRLDRAVTLVDPRPSHVDSGGCPRSVAVVRAWPDEWITGRQFGARDAVVVVTHDPRIDDGAIRAALTSGAGYVAALGSRATHAQRLRRLSGTPGLDRLTGPAGLDLGGESPAETALSILAELVAVQNRRPGHRLRDGRRPIRATTQAA